MFFSVLVKDALDYWSNILPCDLSTYRNRMCDGIHHTFSTYGKKMFVNFLVSGIYCCLTLQFGTAHQRQCRTASYIWTLFALFLLCLISVETLEMQSMVTVNEGEQGIISFIHECNESQLQYDIRFGSGLPFFENGRMRNDRLNEAQQGRLRVVEEQNYQNVKLIHIMINETIRTDGGTYRCRFYTDGEPLDKFVSFIVQFSPGNVSCTWSKVVYYEWHTLKCEARGGSPPGNIICNQNNNILRPIYEFDKNKKTSIGTNIVGSFSVIKTGIIRCCAQNAMNEQSSCDDFCWPSRCFSSTSITPVSTSSSHTFSPVPTTDLVDYKAYPTQLTPCTQKSETRVMSLLAVPLVVLLVFIIVALAIILLKEKRKQGNHSANNVQRNNGESIPLHDLESVNVSP